MHGVRLEEFPEVNYIINGMYTCNLVEAHCYGKGMTGQFLSGHVAVKQIEGKTFRPRRSSSVTILKKITMGPNIYSNQGRECLKEVTGDRS